MQKLMMMFEDVWVTVAFAEAGEYGTLAVYSVRRLHSGTSVRMQQV